MTTPAINDFVRWVVLSDGSVLMYNMKTAQYLEIKQPLTALVWASLDGTRSVDEVVAVVNEGSAGRYPAVDTAAMERLLSGLVRMGLIEMKVSDQPVSA